MMGREEGRAKGKAAVPSKKAARLGGSSLHTKGFTITDLLGLEAELQPPLATATTVKGTGGQVARGGSALPLGLGFLCGQPYLMSTCQPFLPAPTKPRPPGQHLR